MLFLHGAYDQDAFHGHFAVNTLSRCWPMLVVTLLLTACTSQWRPARHALPTVPTQIYDDTRVPQRYRYRQRKDSAPDPSLMAAALARVPEPVPKVEPRSRHGNKSSYWVRGKRYVVRRSVRGYRVRGIASFYGKKFQGHRTSNGEIYNMYRFTAASKVLPLPSYARVTNLKNGRSVMVRVNDRGPFHGHRIIDLSYAAAVRIGLWRRGIGPVEVEGIDPSIPYRKKRKSSLSAKKTSNSKRLFLQSGAFTHLMNARRLLHRMEQAKLAPVKIVDVVIDGRSWHRVLLGPLKTIRTMYRIRDRIVHLGLPRPRIVTR